jgi:hypothetical protein
VITGYRGESDRYTAVLSGEVDAALVGSNHLYSDKGSLQALLWIGGRPKSSTAQLLEELPLSATTRSFLKAVTLPSRYGRTYLLPPGTPQELVAVLQKSFEQTVKDPEFAALTSKFGVDALSFQSATQTKAGIKEVLSTPPEAVELLNQISGRRPSKAK